MNAVLFLGGLVLVIAVAQVAYGAGVKVGIREGKRQHVESLRQAHVDTFGSIDPRVFDDYEKLARRYEWHEHRHPGEFDACALPICRGLAPVPHG